jgi:hypothetical protein
MNQEGNPRRRDANQCGLARRQKGYQKRYLYRCAKSYINDVGASGPPRNSELSLLARRLERSGNKFRTLRNSSTVDLRLGSTVLHSGLASHTSFSYIVDLRMTGDHHASRWKMDDGTHRRTTVRSSLCISWPSKFTTFSCEQLASRLASHPNFLVRLSTHSSSTLPLTCPLVWGAVVVGSFHCGSRLPCIA